MLLQASGDGQLKAVELLLAASADINVKDRWAKIPTIDGIFTGTGRATDFPTLFQQYILTDVFSKPLW